MADLYLLAIGEYCRMVREIAEDDHVSDAIDAACETCMRLRDAWYGLLWLLARNPTIGQDLGLGVRCPNRFLVVDRFVDSRCQSHLSSAWWRSILNEKRRIETRDLRTGACSLTV